MLLLKSGEYWITPNQKDNLVEIRAGHIDDDALVGIEMTPTGARMLARELEKRANEVDSRN